MTSTEKAFVDIPTQEEIFLDKSNKNVYGNYINDSLKIDKIFDTYNIMNDVKRHKIDHYFEGEYIYVQKTFPEEVILRPEIENFYYKINLDGFRSKPFTKINNNKTNVLFAGCSITFGQGLPDGLCWIDFLINKMSAKFEMDIDYYNVALPGAGVFLNFKNIMAFINKVGIPDYLFMILPETTRSVYWDEEHKKFENVLLSSHFREVDNIHRKNYIQENNLFTNITAIHAIEYICKILNIKLLWTSWNPVSADLYKKFDFKNFFKLNFSHPLSLIPPKIFHSEESFKEWIKHEKEYKKDLKVLNSLNVNNLPYWTVARDLLHPGTCFSEFYSNEFLKRIGP